jgi:hypothetical protein
MRGNMYMRSGIQQASQLGGTNYTLLHLPSPTVPGCTGAAVFADRDAIPVVPAPAAFVHEDHAQICSQMAGPGK